MSGSVKEVAPTIPAVPTEEGDIEGLFADLCLALAGGGSTFHSIKRSSPEVVIYRVKVDGNEGIARIVGRRGHTYKALVSILNTLAYPTGIKHRLVVSGPQEEIGADA